MDKKVMTIQQFCDQLTVLCHEGYAQSKIKVESGMKIKDVTGIEIIGKKYDIAVIKSEE